MGRVSLELLVHTVDNAIKRDHLEAREKIFELIKKARKEDPEFFEIPFNPFNTVCDPSHMCCNYCFVLVRQNGCAALLMCTSQDETDSEEEDDDDERAHKWYLVSLATLSTRSCTHVQRFRLAGLKTSSSPTAKEVLKIRKELYRRVQVCFMNPSQP
jgi:hypothetical protein